MTIQDTKMSRRTMLTGFALTTAAVGTALATARAIAEEAPVVAPVEDIGKLPRRRVELVSPPNVHAHDQIAKSGPEIVEFTMTTIEK